MIKNISNEYIIIFKIYYNSILEIHFIKIGSFYKIEFYNNTSDTMGIKKFFSKSKFNSYKLDFSYKHNYVYYGYNKIKPKTYIEWIFSNRKIYEHNYGRIFKLSDRKSDIEKNYLKIEFKNYEQEYYSYEEIKNYIHCYENIYEGIFSNDYTKEYSNKNVNFIKI